MQLLKIKQVCSFVFNFKGYGEFISVQLLANKIEAVTKMIIAYSITNYLCKQTDFLKIVQLFSGILFKFDKLSVYNNIFKMKNQLSEKLPIENKADPNTDDNQNQNQYYVYSNDSQESSQANQQHFYYGEGQYSQNQDVYIDPEQFYDLQQQQQIPERYLNFIFDDPFLKQRFYRMYKFPASIQQAKVHKNACKFGINAKQMKNSSIVPLCPCCLLPINTLNYPLCTNLIPSYENIAYQQQKILFPTGASLYFIFIKICIYYLIIHFLICNTFNIWSSYKGHYCHQHPNDCAPSPYTYTSGYNKHAPEDKLYINILDLLDLIFTISSIFIFYQFRKYLYKANNILDYSYTSQQQFSVLIENIPIFVFEEGATTSTQQSFQYQKIIKKDISDKVENWIKKVKTYKNKEDIANPIKKNYFQKILKENVKSTNPTKPFEQNISTAVNQKNKVSQNNAKVVDPIKDTQIIKSITLCYNLQQFQRISKLRDQLMEQFIQFYNENVLDTQIDISKQQKVEVISQQIKYNSNYYIQINQARFVKDKRLKIRQLRKELMILNEQYIKLSKKFAINQSVSFNLSSFLGKAFVTFQYEHYKHYLINKYNQDPNFFKIMNHQVQISQAMAPTDILWENLNLTNEERQQRILSTYTVMMIVIIIAFFIIVGIEQILMTFQQSTDIGKFAVIGTEGNGLQLWEENAKDVVGTLQNAFLNIVFLEFLPVLTVICNFVLLKLVVKLIDYEKHKSRGQLYLSFVIKNVAARFLTTTLIYYIVYCFHREIGPLTQIGLVVKVLCLIIITISLQLLLQIANSKDIISAAKKLLFKITHNQKENQNLFQVQLNKRTQLPTFNYSNHFIYYLSTLNMVFFYSTLCPEAIPICIIFFVMNYWLDRYNLINRCSSAEEYTYPMMKSILKLFESSLLAFAIGNLIFDIQIRNEYSPIFLLIDFAILGIAAGYIYFASFSTKKYEKWLFSYQKLQFYNISYSQFVKRQPEAKKYWSQNPATFYLKEQDLNKIGQNNSADFENIKLKQRLNRQLFQPNIAGIYDQLTKNDVKPDTYNSQDVAFFKKFYKIKETNEEEKK